MITNKLRLCLLAVGFTTLCSVQAQASDWSATVNVTQVETSYIPASLFFKVDAAVGSCGANTALSWNAKGSTADQQNANVEAAYALLLTAKASGRSISIIGNNAGCTIDYLYLN